MRRCEADRSQCRSSGPAGNVYRELAIGFDDVVKLPDGTGFVDSLTGESRTNVSVNGCNTVDVGQRRPNLFGHLLGYK